MRAFSARSFSMRAFSARSFSTASARDGPFEAFGFDPCLSTSSRSSRSASMRPLDTGLDAFGFGSPSRALPFDVPLPAARSSARLRCGLRRAPSPAALFGALF
jgi:hypothetical protein